MCSSSRLPMRKRPLHSSMGRISMGGILTCARTGSRGQLPVPRLGAAEDSMGRAGIPRAEDSIIMGRAGMVDGVGIMVVVEDMVGEVGMAGMAEVEDMVDVVGTVVVGIPAAVGMAVVDTAEMADTVDPQEVVAITIINLVNPSHQTTLPTTHPPAEKPPQQSTSQT